MADAQPPCVVIDNGSDTCKAGYAGDDDPKIIPTVLCQDKTETYVGDAAQSKRGLLNMKYPIERGIVTDWDDMEKIWQYVYSELGATPGRHPVLLTEPPLNPKTNKEKTAQIMFETFQVPTVFVGVQAVFALLASGRTSGVSLDIGYGVTHAVPITDGNAQESAIQCLDFGGSDLTHYLKMILTERGHSLTSEVARDVKENLGYIATDFNKEMEKAAASASTLNANYILPDGKEITIGAERFRCPEALFKPSLLGKESDGIHDAIQTSILKSVANTRKKLYSNIVISGGSSLFDSISDRMQQEITGVAPPGTNIRVYARPERKLAAWLGGSTLASLPTFRTMWMSRQEYEEAGPSAIHRRRP